LCRERLHLTNANNKNVGGGTASILSGLFICFCYFYENTVSDTQMCANLLLNKTADTTQITLNESQIQMNNKHQHHDISTISDGCELHKLLTHSNDPAGFQVCIL
jgi:hypothetical protein